MTDFDAMRARHVPTIEGSSSLPSSPTDRTWYGPCRADGQPWPCDFIQADGARRWVVEAADAVVRGWNATEREEWGKRFTQDIAALRAALAESGS